MLSRITARELREWELLFGIKGEEHELRKTGMSEDAIAARISGDDFEDDEDNESEDG